MKGGSIILTDPVLFKMMQFVYFFLYFSLIPIYTVSMCVAFAFEYIDHPLEYVFDNNANDTDAPTSNLFSIHCESDFN
jgi:hypothetical protein